ncbi:MAG: response regulator transcription factor [Lachnospiraceae bacterium]|nr:response regulator transcription factor [Lachnospiraceae bacterium]
MIYVLEDDSSIREFVVYSLCHMELNAKGFEKPSLFWESVRKELPDLILLDIMLPEEDGLSVLSKLRKHPELKDVPVIMLTAKNSEYDKVMGLDAGADDYVAKPFGIMELVARIKALLRRTQKYVQSNQSDTKLEVGNLKVYLDKHVVKVDGEQISLTLKEYELLTMLMENKGVVLNRDQLLNKIWGYEFDGESRTVDVHIRTLRAKLKSAGNLIETIRGVGYKIGEE